jgi:hypothetical protein
MAKGQSDCSSVDMSFASTEDDLEIPVPALLARRRSSLVLDEKSR